MTLANEPPICRVEWDGAVRIIRSAYPPIDLFEDIADPGDWPLLLSAEQKTNPRIRTSIGNLDLVPPERRVGGNGASYLMASSTSPIAMKLPYSRRSIITPGSWRARPKLPVGHPSFGKSS